MSRARRITVGLAVAALTAFGIGAATVPASATSTLKVPDSLKVPEGNKLIALMPAKGVQTYQCTGNAWVFVQPDAILTLGHTGPGPRGRPGPGSTC